MKARWNSSPLGFSPQTTQESAESTRAQHQGMAPARPLDVKLAHKMIESLNDPSVEVILWDGQRVRNNEGEPIARVTFHNRPALLRVLAYPDLYFGEELVAGRMEIEGDLAGLIERTYKKRSRAMDWYKRAMRAAVGRPRTNSLDGSKQNIHHHYDLGNDFYKLWLDERMQYTCAYYPDPTMTLEQAQRAKMDHVCRKLQLRPGERVVEAGCGWGGMALHMAGRYGVNVRAYNISREQVGYAREWAKREGLEERVEFVEDDYRNIQGQYDAFVSVGMLEHVGPANYGALGRVIDRCLCPEGRGFIHSIGRNRPGLINAWVERHIFPGAHPPTLREMAPIFEPHGFSVLDVENIRLHYAHTLTHWLERFDAHRDEIRSRLGNEFIRAWRLYLCGSIAAFRAGSLQLFQVLFTRERNNDLAPSRAHIYGDSRTVDNPNG